MDNIQRHLLAETAGTRHPRAMVSEEMSDGFTSPPPFSEGFWLSCSSLAARALTCPFVSQLAAGTLARVTFQHYIAQNAFYLAALSEVYERAGACIEDFEAKKLLQELREAVVQELGRYDGYAKVGETGGAPPRSVGNH